MLPSTLRSVAPSCAVCHRSIYINASGLVRVHGPVKSRCPGSHQAPLVGASSPSRAPLAKPSVSAAVNPSSPDLSGLPLLSLHPRNKCKIIKRIPKNSRERVAGKLTTILEAVVANNDHASWDRFLRFGSRCLRVPSSIGRSMSLTSAINEQIDKEQDPPASLGQGLPDHRVPVPLTPLKSLPLVFQRS